MNDPHSPRLRSGINFVESLAHVPILTGVPILIYTSQQDPDVRARALASGAVDLFVKGAEDHALMEKIELLLPQ